MDVNVHSMMASDKLLRWCSVPVAAAGLLVAAGVLAPAASAAVTITVAADGSGNFRSVQAAVDSVAANNGVPVTITIKPGTYRGVVTIPATKPLGPSEFDAFLWSEIDKWAKVVREANIAQK